MRRGRRGSALLAIALVTACGPAEEAEPGGRVAQAELPGVVAGTPRYRLRIVNRRDEAVEVQASSGAGRVVVDTVVARDSGLVELALDADTVRLEAVSMDGETAFESWLHLRADSLNRWEIRPGAPGPPDRGSGL